MNNLFWRKFTRYLLIGFSALALFTVAQYGSFYVLAEDDNCLDENEFSCPEPAGGGEIPNVPAYPAPYTYPTPAEAPPPPPPAISMACTPGEFRRTCTGQCGGCAADAGEARIEQCLADGSGFSEQQSECSKSCVGPCQVTPPPPPPVTPPPPPVTPPPPPVTPPPPPGVPPVAPPPSYVTPPPSVVPPPSVIVLPPPPAPIAAAPIQNSNQNQAQTGTSTGGSASATGGTSSSSATGGGGGGGGNALVGTVTSTSGSSVSSSNATGGSSNVVINNSAPSGGSGSAGSGGTTTVREVRVIAQAPSGQVVASAPQVVRVAGVSAAGPVQELPKTGLPLLAWALGAFLPAGLGVKGYGKNPKGNRHDPNYLWESRRFKSSV